METDYLKLVKHAAGDEGWADDMNNNLDEIDSRFDNVNSNLASIDAQFDDINSNLANFDAQFDDINNYLTNIDTGFNWQSYSSNPIINGDFRIWKRGTSGFGSEYNADRWLSLANSGSMTAERVAFTPGQTNVPGEPEAYLNHNITVAGDILCAQLIEDVRTYANQVLSFDFWTYVDSPTSIEKITIGQNFGTGGSEPVYTQAILDEPNLKAGWNNITGYCSVPSIAGKTIGTNSYLLFRADVAETYTGNWGISQVNINPGSTSYPFKPRQIALEEQLCQRYYQKILSNELDTYFSSGVSYSSTLCVFPIVYSIPMRAAPTVICNGPFALVAGTVVKGVSSILVEHINEWSCGLAITASNLSGGQGAVLRGGFGESYISFNAELY